MVDFWKTFCKKNNEALTQIVFDMKMLLGRFWGMLAPGCRIFINYYMWESMVFMKNMFLLKCLLAFFSSRTGPIRSKHSCYPFPSLGRETPVTRDSKPDGAHLLSNVWFLFDNTEYLCPSRGLTQSTKHMHSPLLTQVIQLFWPSRISRMYCSSSHVSRYSSARSFLQSQRQLDTHKSWQIEHWRNRKWEVYMFFFKLCP